jgi:RimJ/RimL family protein N-acetyltransferase
MLTAPADKLTDGTVTLRLPSSDAGDIVTIESYVQDQQLDGAWLPDVPLVTAQQVMTDWHDGWAGRNSRYGPAFVVTVPDEPRFIGVVSMAERGDGAIHLSYGTAPRWRGRGLASHAARLAGQWVARQPDVQTVEARISPDDRAAERVAVNAGFVLAATMTQSDPGTGQTSLELRYVMKRPERPGSAPR